MYVHLAHVVFDTVLPGLSGSCTSGTKHILLLLVLVLVLVLDVKLEPVTLTATSEADKAETFITTV